MRKRHILSPTKSTLTVDVSECGLEQRCYIGAVNIGVPDKVQFVNVEKYATCKTCRRKKGY